MTLTKHPKTHKITQNPKGKNEDGDEPMSAVDRTSLLGGNV